MAALFVSVEGARVWKLLEVLVNDAEVDLRSVLTCRYKMQDMLAALPGSFPVQGPPAFQNSYRYHTCPGSVCAEWDARILQHITCCVRFCRPANEKGRAGAVAFCMVFPYHGAHARAGCVEAAKFDLYIVSRLS